MKDVAPLAFETKALEVQKFTFRITAADPPSNVFAGNWEAVGPGAYGFTAVDLIANGTNLTGTVSQPRASVQISDGHIDGVELVFKATSGDGDRTITLRGKLEGDEIRFTREFVLRPGGFPGTQGIFGAAGPSTFVAKRIDL